MKCTLVIWFCAILRFSGARFLWPNSYTFKAVLTVPGAEVVEPYQVWYDGDTKKSRVDFYDGMDRLYRQYDSRTQKCLYYKIHPETTNKYTNKDVCDALAPSDSLVISYDQSNYLPYRDFQFQYSEVINGTKAEKWVKSYDADKKYNAVVNYNVWVRFEDGKTTAIPVRYDYEMKTDDVVVDFFRHDFTYFDDGKPESELLELPLEPKCNLKVLEDEPVDPLLEYVEPNIQEIRISELYYRFKTKHNKSYDGEEHSRRLNIFKNNFRYIHSVNREHRSFSLAINHLADLTDAEISVFMGTMFHDGSGIDDITVDIGSDDVIDDDDVENDLEGPADKTGFDWRDYGAITPVKDQTGLCGACYAFTAAAVVESSAYIARGCKRLEELSEQAILDCDWDHQSGCSGGDYTSALSWAKFHGIPTRKEYGPYLAMEGRCHIEDMKKVASVPKSYKLLKKMQLIKETLRTRGPLAAAIDGKMRSFLFYSKGVYDDQRCRSEPHERSHAVTIVGYGKEGDKKYWILKNTFGKTWGEDGYIRINVEDNVCGVKNFLYTVNYQKNKVEKCFNKKQRLQRTPHNAL